MKRPRGERMLASGLGVYRFVKWGNEQGTASACSPLPAAVAAGGRGMDVTENRFLLYAR